ncbi:MAG: hypothetical protein ACYCT0_12675, partial [Sulfobacillus sp.]
MATGQDPRDPRRPREPMAGLHIQGIEDRRFSEKVLRNIEAQAEKDAENDHNWEATNAYAPANRPIIRQQLNPLMVAEKYRDWPELWAVYVPHTTTAFSSRQLLWDRTQRTHPDQLKARWRSGAIQGTEPPPPTDEELTAIENEGLETPVAPQSLGLTARLYPSAEEAERAAQAIWRQYWTQYRDQLAKESQDAMADNAAITVVRQAEFTVDMTNPAHVAQYEFWLAQFPDGLPPHVTVHQKHADLVELAPAALGTGDPSRDPASWPDPDHSDWELKFPVQNPWTLARFATEAQDLTSVASPAGDTAPADSVPADSVPQKATEARRPGSWEVRAIAPHADAEDPHSPPLWALARRYATPDGETWEFWRNGTGRTVAFDAKTPEKVLGMVPRALGAVVSDADQTVSHMAALHDLWQLSRQADRYQVAHPAVQDWLAAEQAVGQPLIAWMQEAQGAPGRQAALKTLRTEVVALHTQVFPSDGIVQNSAEKLPDHYDQILHLAQTVLPPGDRREKFLGFVHKWREAAEGLNQDSLGLFRYGRVPDIAFVDYDMESSARLNGVSEWIANPLPSGAMLLGTVDHKGRIGWVELPRYSPEAARIHVADQGGI